MALSAKSALTHFELQLTVCSNLRHCERSRCSYPNESAIISIPCGKR